MYGMVLMNIITSNPTYTSTVAYVSTSVSPGVITVSSIQTANAYPVYGVQPSRIALLPVDTDLEIGATITNTKQVVILSSFGPSTFPPKVFLDTTGFTDGQFITINPNGVSTIIDTQNTIRINGSPETTFGSVITLVSLNNNWYSMQ